jgi:hypothetical protein
MGNTFWRRMFDPKKDNSIQNLAVKWVTLLLRIRKVPCLNLDLYTCQPDWSFSCFFPVPPPRQISTLRYYRSLRKILPNSSFTHQPTIRRYVVPTLIALLNNQPSSLMPCASNHRLLYRVCKGTSEVSIYDMEVVVLEQSGRWATPSCPILSVTSSEVFACSLNHAVCIFFLHSFEICCLHSIGILNPVGFVFRNFAKCRFCFFFYIVMILMTPDTWQYIVTSTLDCSVATLLNTYVMWHVDPLLGNDREISNCTTAVM